MSFFLLKNFSSGKSHWLSPSKELLPKERLQLFRRRKMGLQNLSPNSLNTFSKIFTGLIGLS
jgi:hypothetical protein